MIGNIKSLLKSNPTVTRASRNGSSISIVKPKRRLSLMPNVKSLKRHLKTYMLDYLCQGG